MLKIKSLKNYFFSSGKKFYKYLPEHSGLNNDFFFFAILKAGPISVCK